MKLLTLLTLFITLLLDDSLVVFGQDVKRDYVNLAKLSVEEEKKVIALAYKCGLQEPVNKISTHNMYPSPFKGIRVEGKEKKDGRQVTTQILSVSNRAWLEPNAKPRKGQISMGKFWAGKPYEQKKIILNVKGKQYRASSIQGLSPEECEMILNVFLEQKYQLGPQVKDNEKLLDQIDWTNPSGFYKRGDSISVGFLHKEKDSGFFDLQITKKGTTITIQQIFQAIP